MSGRPRFMACVGAGAFVGAAFACTIAAFDALATAAPGVDVSAGDRFADVVLVNLLGAVPEITFRPFFFLFLHHGYLYFGPILVLLLWRRSRGPALWAWCAVPFLLGFTVAAFACAVAYGLDHAWGLLPGAIALPVAVVLARWRRWHPSSTLVLAGGLVVGTVLAQAFYTFPSQDNEPVFHSPAWGFVPPVALSLALVIGLTWGRQPRSNAGSASGLAMTWGLLATAAGCAVAVAVELTGMRVRTPDPPGSRLFRDWAYDVYVTGEPAQLVWTDRRRIHVLTNPYGGDREHYTVDDDQAYYVERIWSSPTGGFYVQGNNKFEWWPDPQPGDRVSYRPAERYPSPPWLQVDSSSLWTVAEDPLRRRLFTVGEYYSRYVVIDRDDGSVVAQGVLSDALWPFWHFTSDPVGRRLYITSALDDGGLYEMNLDSLAVTRRARNLYLYETILDRTQNLLWGVRPLSGEVVAVDVATGRARVRVPVEFGLRDLQRDPASGKLYTCSEIFGDIFEIDGATHAVSRLGWCGRLCRSMYLDTRRQALWVATRDGVCRIDVGD